MIAMCGETDAGWRMELIATRAKRMGLGGPDLDDAVQEIAPHVIGFRFNSERSNGASLRTVLISVIDRQLLAIRRREARYAKREKRARDEKYTEVDANGHVAEPRYPDLVPLVTDVKSAICQLDETERRICELLSEGRSVQEIALDLSLDWHTVDRRIQRIRNRFQQIGLGGWLDCNH